MKQILKRDRIIEIAVFMLIFLTSSFVICNDIWSSTVTIGLWLVTAGLLLLKSHTIDRKFFFIIVILIICMGVNTIVNNENIRTYLVLCFSYAVVLLIVSQITWMDFCKFYCGIMKILCIISLVGYCMFMIVPSLHRVLVTVTKGGYFFSNFILYVDATYNNRNMGMFWEPGAFQTFINLALLFEVSSHQPRIKNVIILLITIISTYSTTGYIGLVFVLLFWYAKEGTKKNVKTILVVIAIIGLGVICFSPQVNSLLFGASLSNGQSTVFGKIIAYMSGSSTIASTSVRYNSIFEVMKAFFEKPIIGYGYQGLSIRTYELTRGMNTCTFINWFATYGIVYGITMLVGILKLARKVNISMLNKVLYVMVVFIVTMSENYVQNSFFVLLAMFGYSAITNQSDTILDSE